MKHKASKKLLGKLRRRARVAATYRKITIPLQEAIVDEAMPATMTFYIDNRFTAAHEKAIKRMLMMTVYSWVEHFDAVDANDPAGHPLKFRNCMQKYAKYNLSPVWFEEKISNGGAALDIMMDGFTTAFANNGFGRVPKAYIMYGTGDFTIKAANGNDPEKNSLSVTVNPSMLENSAYGDSIRAGSLWHAWMHRLGYRHPAGKYTSYAIGEAPMCIMRNHQNKLPTEKESKFTSLLD
ncbi:hypothetical protein [Paenibacillus sp. Y412MC10]|uniref:hypothetical protein n=1 Tax=Geobacillus sp. (strain Y412MC10) TaxID=481743 RepID=UPI0011A51B43|nr:hypothetical protein [Paenibacillus sp. Y412MC10]